MPLMLQLNLEFWSSVVLTGNQTGIKESKIRKNAVEDRIKEDCKRWKKFGLTSSPKIILSNSESTRDDSEVFQEAISRCIFYGADELLFVSNNGEKIYRWKR